MSFLRGLQPKTKQSTEGKTAEGDKPMCQGCEGNTATKYCHSCTDALCTPCSKSHAKYAGPNHIVTDLSEKSMNISQLVPKSGEENPEFSTCVCHVGQGVSRICKHCRIVVCESCIKDSQHKGHEMVTFENGATVLQEMCTQGVKQLLDDISRVGNIPSAGVSLSSEPIDSAIQQIKQKHAEFTKNVHACVTDSISRLEKEKLRIKTEMTGVKNSAVSNVEKMELTVTQLNNARKTRDIESMVEEITRYSHLREEVGLFIEVNGKSKQETCIVKDIIPGINKYERLSREVIEMFDAKIPGNEKFAYKYMRTSKSIKLKEGSKYCMVYIPHWVADCCTIKMHTRAGRDVSIVNYKTSETEELQAGCDILGCFQVSSNRHIALASDGENESLNIHLLDDKFQTLHKIPIPEGIIKMNCFCENEFVIFFKNNTSENSAFNIYQITKDKIELKKRVNSFPKLRALGDGVDDDDTFLLICDTQSKNKIALFRTSRKSAEKSWFDCSIVDLKSHSVVKYEGNVGVNLPYIADNGDLLVCTANDELRVYRDIENGVDDYKVLDNVEVGTGCVGVVRHGDNLILGYANRVDCFSFE